MIFKFDEYVQTYPNRVVSALKKFDDIAKNLHEMSTDEVNAITEKWSATTEATAANLRNMIKLYFEWLENQGIKVVPSISDIVFPVKQTQFLVYNSETLHATWDKLLLSCERKATLDGTTGTEDRLLITYAAGILAFYGLTTEQILALDLSDIQKDGVIGYDLPLTEKDIDVLLRYKSLTRFKNNQVLSGTKYIRAIYEVSAEIIDRPLGIVKCCDSEKYLASVLTHKNLSKLGAYSRIYDVEQSTEPLNLSEQYALPEWFFEELEKATGKKIINTRRSSYKKDYKAYRDERRGYETKNNKAYVAKIEKSFKQLENVKPAEPKPSAELLSALAYVTSALTEVDALKKNLLKIQAEIETLIKK